MIPNTKYQPAKVLAATGAVCLTGHRCCREGSCSAVSLGREQQLGKLNIQLALFFTFTFPHLQLFIHSVFHNFCCKEGSCSAVGLGREQQFGKFNWSHIHFPLSFHTCCQPYLLLVQKHLFLCSGSRNGSPIRKIEHSTGPFSLLLSTTFTLFIHSLLTILVQGFAVGLGREQYLSSSFSCTFIPS